MTITIIKESPFHEPTTTVYLALNSLRKEPKEPKNITPNFPLAKPPQRNHSAMQQQPVTTPTAPTASPTSTPSTLMERFKDTPAYRQWDVLNNNVQNGIMVGSGALITGAIALIALPPLFSLFNPSPPPPPLSTDTHSDSILLSESSIIKPPPPINFDNEAKNLGSSRVEDDLIKPPLPLENGININSEELVFYQLSNSDTAMLRTGPSINDDFIMMVTSDHTFVVNDPNKDGRFYAVTVYVNGVDSVKGWLRVEI